MRLPLQVGIRSLALTSALPGHGTKSRRIEENDFVYVQGLRLYDAEGLHYLTGKTAHLFMQTTETNTTTSGMNYWACMVGISVQ
jgi:ribosomal protein S12